MNNRDFNTECKDGINNYYYNFDIKMRYKIIKNLEESINIKIINNILEVGCFEGQMTSILNDIFKNIDVVEPSIECIEKIKYNYKNINFINTTLENYDTEKKYDLIIICHTLEHTNDPIMALKKAKSLLSDDGYIYIIVPNGTSISRLIAHKLNIIKYPCCVTDGEKEHGHHITYDLYTLERHVHDSNLNIFKIGGIVLKIFGNKQYDDAFKYDIINDKFIDACYELGKNRPMDCASIYIIAKK
jgi:2-polyprenyl-3-methyl-5-hydroxy-6-metoxy-1,4-benzoquinol methylase